MARRASIFPGRPNTNDASVAEPTGVLPSAIGIRDQTRWQPEVFPNQTRIVVNPGALIMAPGLRTSDRDLMPCAYYHAHPGGSHHFSQCCHYSVGRHIHVDGVGKNDIKTVVGKRGQCNCIGDLQAHARKGASTELRPGLPDRQRTDIDASQYCAWIGVREQIKVCSPAASDFQSAAPRA